MVEADIPKPKPDEVLVKVRRSLISRGSELFRRYVMEEAVPPSMMGYSDAGDVIEVGADLHEIEPGQRVSVSALTPSTWSARLWVSGVAPMPYPMK